MIVGEICTRSVITCARVDTVRQAADLMRHHHVGNVIVTVEDRGGRKPVGIVTDRDIVIEILAAQLDPEVITTGDMCSQPLITVAEKAGALDAMQLMRRHGIRRLPVVGTDGLLVGIVTADDLVEAVAEALGDLSKAIAMEQSREAKLRR